MTDALLVDVKDGIAWLTFNRPQVRNAAGDGMSDKMLEVLPKFAADPEIRCIVFRGAGGHFMAGGDVKRFNTYLEMSAEERQRTFAELIHRVHPMILTMREMSKPILASVQGGAAGFGMALMMACDLVVAAEDSFFTLAYCHLGTSPDGGSSYSLPRMLGMKHAMEIALLGKRFDARKALDLGLVNWVVPTDQLAAETDKLASRLAAGPTHAYGNTKRLLYDSLGRSMAEQLDAEVENFVDCAATEDFAEGIRAFAEKRKTEFRGR